MGMMEWLVYHRRSRLARELMLLYGLDVPRQVAIGRRLVLQHRAQGTVVHPDTRIDDDVTIYHRVTIARADAHIPRHMSPMERIVISDNAVLYPGCVVLGGSGTTRVGSGTIIAPNAVLTRSTGDWEIWGGVPARKIGDRPNPGRDGDSLDEVTIG